MFPTWRRIVWLLEDGRIRDAVALLAYESSERYHEWRLGIRTVGYVARNELGFESADANAYMPTDYRGFKQVMDQVKITPQQDVFLDMGSGMGRVIVLAATYPFRKVIGVEASQQLNVIARENLSRARRHLRCSDVELVATNAVSYAVPPDVTHVYFYNPFGETGLARVLANLHVSFAKTPRKMTVVFKNPVCLAGVGQELAWLRKCAEHRANGGPYVVYETEM